MAKPPGRATRALMRLMMRFEAGRFRRSGGKARGPGKNPQLLLTTVGRKSGQPRTVPLFYVADGDRLVVIASYGGSDSHPAWWLNLRANGRGTVELDGESFIVTPTVLEGEERDRCWRQMTQFWPSYDTYATKTDRQIPVVALAKA
ncbi:MAG: nitroreductase family deazaflavin-dependent oxidoreductase [Streptosporangiales bacterium]|nr:nitroreductase family deazaflavin-dependent oxidoreductase [Streptosporangiales bacterium]